MQGKVVILSAPSGAGKSTIVRYLMGQGLHLQFSVSATNRPPRGTERQGVEYFFLSTEAFRRRIEAGDFLEYEEVYEGRFYGTLKSEVERIWQEGGHALFDIDVAGGCHLKSLYGTQALSLFIAPPNLAVLRERLEKRGTDSPEMIAQRLAKAGEEMAYAPRFDAVVVNDRLEEAQASAAALVKKFLAS
ncbi:MAG: guanylate kinase [Tannerella sp.]|jgi:guanylate kinase|nr:guanylate kinase [Tannerella sp.]